MTPKLGLLPNVIEANIPPEINKYTSSKIASSTAPNFSSRLIPTSSIPTTHATLSNHAHSQITQHAIMLGAGDLHGCPSASYDGSDIRTVSPALSQATTIPYMPPDDSPTIFSTLPRSNFLFPSIDSTPKLDRDEITSDVPLTGNEERLHLNILNDPQILSQPQTESKINCTNHINTSDCAHKIPYCKEIYRFNKSLIDLRPVSSPSIAAISQYVIQPNKPIMAYYGEHIRNLAVTRLSDATRGIKVLPQDVYEEMTKTVKYTYDIHSGTFQ